MNILIIGAFGMLGQYLAKELLNAGHNVVLTGRKIPTDKIIDKNVSYALIDITQPETFKNVENKTFDSVVHLAGIMPATMAKYSPEQYFLVNSIGTLNVLEFCRTNNVKQIIFTQTHSDLSGHWGQSDPIDPYAPVNFTYGNDHTIYSISKRAAMDIIKHYNALCGLKYAIFRCPNIYSWHQNDFFYVDSVKQEIGWRKIIKKALNSEDIEIWGDAGTRKDLMYVKDLTWMIRTAIEKQIEHSVYNAANGESSSLKEQMLTIAKIFNPSDKPSKIIYRPDKKVKLNNHHYCIDNAVKELGYKPKYFLKEMFEDMKKEMEFENR
ncbi:MAG: NAD(P)-dependent oxidoreductase [Alphaproteobacteria bacterium]|nr:NAD(P)-dependent oxidoreductase [Alphaproteobacteria bacterium]